MTIAYNVAQLLKSEVGQTRVYEFSSDDIIDLEDACVSQIRGQVKLTLTNFGIIATGRAEGNLRLACARCLESFDTIVPVSFEEEYQPVIDIATGLPSSAPRSDSAFVITRNHTIDITEALRQDFVLAVEIIPVCRPDCRGLCPNCGANRNLETCKCPPDEAISPFSVLSGLLVEADAKKSS